MPIIGHTLSEPTRHILCSAEPISHTKITHEAQGELNEIVQCATRGLKHLPKKTPQVLFRAGVLRHLIHDTLRYFRGPRYPERGTLSG